MEQWITGIGVGVVTAAVLWLFTMTVRNRERIVKLETEFAWQRQTINNIDGKVDRLDGKIDRLIELEARRKGREDSEVEA